MSNKFQPTITKSNDIPFKVSYLSWCRPELVNWKTIYNLIFYFFYTKRFITQPVKSVKEWTWVLHFHTSGLPCDDCEDELLHLVAFQQQHPRLLHVSPHVLINSNLYRCEFVEVPVAPGPPGPQILGAHVPRSVPHDEASILHPRRDKPFSLVLDQGIDPCDGDEGVLGVGHGPVAESKLNPHRLAPVDLELEFEFLNKPDININYNYPCCYKLWIKGYFNIIVLPRQH